MLSVELIGLRTALYEEIRQSLLSIVEISNIKAEILEYNSPEYILANNYKSIPLVQVNETKIYFTEADSKINIKSLRRLLISQAPEKSHSCRNCGNCKCPTSRISDRADLAGSS